jgi:hypothetical protein
MAEHDSVRIIPYSPEDIPDTGSFKVVWPGGKRYFFWDENAGRRSISKTVKMTRAQALEQAKALAREKRAAIEHACLLCEDTGWVCEDHPDQPWEGPHACRCGAAGAPCPHCNRPDNGEPPRMPIGFKPDGG